MVKSFHVTLCKLTPSHLTVTARVLTDAGVRWRRYKVQRLPSLHASWQQAVGEAWGRLPHDERTALGHQPQQLPLELA